jgi:hypothetical protein
MKRRVRNGTHSPTKKGTPRTIVEALVMKVLGFSADTEMSAGMWSLVETAWGGPLPRNWEDILELLRGDPARAERAVKKLIGASGILSRAYDDAGLPTKESP